MCIKLTLSNHLVCLPASDLLLFTLIFYFLSAGCGDQPGFQGQPLGLCEWGKSPRVVRGAACTEHPPLGKAQGDPFRPNSDWEYWSEFWAPLCKTVRELDLTCLGAHLEQVATRGRLKIWVHEEVRSQRGGTGWGEEGSQGSRAGEIRLEMGSEV